MKKTPEIFCCYAKRDRSLLLELKQHLSLLQRQGYISLYAHTDITLGNSYETEINKHIDTAQIILLLVSPTFIASEYCYSKEMVHAMERHERGDAYVIPIILRPVDMEDAPFSKLLSLPKNRKPITTWKIRDKAFENIAQEIRKLIQSFDKKDVEDLLHKSFSELTAQKTMMDIIDKIPLLANAGQREDALMVCERLLRDNYAPEYASFYKGRILFDMNRYEEALQAFEHTIHLIPDQAYAYQGKVCTLQALHRHEEALTSCNQAIASCSPFSPLYALKAHMLSRLGRDKEVLETCDDWLGFDPNNHDAYTIKILALIQLGSYQEALDVCEYLPSGDLHITALKILILDKMGDHQSSVELYQALADVDVSLILDAGPYMAKVLQKLERYTDAISVCNHAIRQYSDDVETHGIKLHCLLSLQRYHEALETCDHLTRLCPQKGEVFAYRAIALAALGRYGEGLIASEQAISLGFTVTAYTFRAICLQGMGRNMEALTACEEAIHRQPGDPLPYLTQGKALYALQRYDEALKAYEQSIHLDPNEAQAWYGKSKAFEQLGNAEEAMRAYERARKLDSGNVSG